MSGDLSIDEILKQAEEIRQKKTKEATVVLNEIIETLPNEGTPSKEKTAVVEPVSQKTTTTPKVPEKDQIDLKPADDKTRAINNVEKGQTSFFRRDNTAGPIYSKEPPGFIEKPATIRSKSKFDKTSDLQEIPTIMAVDELENTRIMGNIAEPKSIVPLSDDENVEDASQIMLEGFDDEISNVPVIDEDVAEKLLHERRKDKVNKFRLFAPEGANAEGAAKQIVKSGYRNNEEKTAVFERLFGQKFWIHIAIIFTIILGIPLFLLTVFRDSTYLPDFFVEHNTYFISVIILFSLILVANINNIIHAFNFKHGINYDFPIVISSILVMVHTVFLLINPELLIESASVFPSAITFAFFLSSMGKRALLVRIIENFEFITDGSEKYTVETIQNIVDSSIISRGLLKGDANLKSSVKTEFPTDFLEIGCSLEPADKISGKTGIVMLVLNAILCGVVAYVTKNLYLGVNIAACGICISLPAVSLYATNLSLLGVSRTLFEKGALVNGFEGAAMVDGASALVLEAHDLFGAKSCDLHGIKTFNGAKIDDAILQTAAVIIKTKSPLLHVFDDVIVGKQSILPEVDGVIYEDKMGTSGWIYKKKILVGNRDLLIHHGVSVPKEEYEQKYTRNGRKALYLAVAGKIMAMFIVSYTADAELGRALRKLEKSGMTILVRSYDPFINEESIAALFDLPDGYMRVMSSSSGRVFEKYSDLNVEKSPAYVVHNGSALGFITAMRGAESLVEIKGMLSVLISFGCAIGFGIVALLAIIGGYSQLNILSVIIFQSVWSLFVLLISKLKRLNI